MESSTDKVLLVGPSAEVEVFVEDLPIGHEAILEIGGGIEVFGKLSCRGDFSAQDRLFDFPHQATCSEVCDFDFRCAVGPNAIGPEPDGSMGHACRTDRNDQSRAVGFGRMPFASRLDVAQQDGVSGEGFEVSEAAR